MIESRRMVNSYNEWDPLEEVIIGTAIGSVRSPYEPAYAPFVSELDEFRQFEGGAHTEDAIAAAQRQLDNFADVLERLGVTVRRPDPMNHSTGFSTPDFAIAMGHGQTCPRDVLLVIGDEIIEAPMSQRSRFFEYRAYRRLLREYFRQGATWTVAPKPLMADDLYVQNYSTEFERYNLAAHPSLTESDPCFDAASFMRFGEDIVWQPDVVSNAIGRDWLARHLNHSYRIHQIEFDVQSPQHIDSTLVPLRPGLVLSNPERPCTNGGMSLFHRNDWQVVEAPPSVHHARPAHSREVSTWISMNVLSLDPETVVVEWDEEPLQEMLKGLGFDIVPIAFSSVYRFGGSFHCCSLDVRRSGRLECYFPHR